MEIIVLGSPAFSLNLFMSHNNQPRVSLVWAQFHSRPINITAEEFAVLKALHNRCCNEDKDRLYESLRVLEDSRSHDLKRLKVEVLALQDKV